MDLERKFIRLGETLEVNANSGTITLINENKETKEVRGIIYVLWRKCDGSNTFKDLLDYAIHRTKTEKEFMKEVLIEIFKELEDEKFIK